MREYVLVPKAEYDLLGKKSIVTNVNEGNHSTVYTNPINIGEHSKRSLSHAVDLDRESAENFLHNDSLTPELSLRLFNLYKRMHNKDTTNISESDKKIDNMKQVLSYTQLDPFLKAFSPKKYETGSKLIKYIMDNNLIQINDKGFIIDDKNEFNEIHITAILRIIMDTSAKVPNLMERYLKLIIDKIPLEFISNKKILSIRKDFKDSMLTTGGAKQSKAKSGLLKPWIKL